METKDAVLEAIEKKVALTVSAAFDPQEYYQNRDGLYVWSAFKERTLAKAKKVKEGAKFAVSSFKLLKYATDETIENALPKKHLFSESDVCAIIAELIAKQPKGEEGILIANGYANLFYTSAFVVCVGWGGGEWDVYAWGRDDGEWRGGRRVFSPAN